MNKPAKRNTGKINIPYIESEIDSSISEFRLRMLNEFHAQIMIVVFLASAFTIVIFFNKTLITIIDATRWFALFGSLGFVLSFLLRKKFRLTIMDGLLYNFFGIAPLFQALFLVLNNQCTQSVTETFKVVNHKRGGSGYTLTLENNVLDDYWHIRNLDRDEASIRFGKIRYTFCEGNFGYRVMQERKMVP
jgi:hypothetical protein